MRPRKIKTNRIICDNCISALATELMPDTVDLTVTSPPYDKLRDYKGYDFQFEALAKALYRVTKPGGVVVWVVADETKNQGRSGTSFRHALYFMECGFKLYDDIIYEKTGTSYPSNRRYTNIYEHMFVFSKGKPKTLLPCTACNRSRKSPAGGSANGCRSSMMRAIWDA